MPSIEGLQHEIEELKERNKSLEVNALKYQMLFEQSADAFSILNLETGKFTECNSSAVSMHGVESEKNFLNASPGDLSPEFQPCGGRSDEMAMGRIQKTFTEGPQIFNWTHCRLDGTTFPCLVSLSPIVVGEERFVMAIGRDISELVNTQEELKEANEQLKNSHFNSRLASVGELSAGIGHEINNPLTIANGNIRKIERYFSQNEISDETIEKAFSKYYKASKRIENIVNGLRVFATAGKSKNEKCKPAEAVENTVQLIEEIFRNENISIVIEENSTSAKALIDIGELQQVILNLLTNSKDALLAVSEDRKIMVKTITKGDQIVISISDNGMGIDEKIKDKIFDAFVTSKEPGKGTGLGLSISHSIIKKHDGTLSFESTETGTSFYINLPVCE